MITSSSSVLQPLCLPASSLRGNILRTAGAPMSLRPRHINLCVRAASSDGCNTSQPLQKVLSRAAAVCLALVMTTTPASSRAAESFEGVPRIIDGDTIEVAGKRVRLYGIDAPESKQSCRTAGGDQYPCGVEAAERLRARVGNDRVRCEVKATDQYKRSVAVCSTPSVQLNEWMVDQGQAVAYREYGKDYVPSEEAAHAAHRGLWAGAFDVPSDWRKERKIEQLERSLRREKPAVDAQLSRSAPRGFGPSPSQPGKPSPPPQQPFTAVPQPLTPVPQQSNPSQGASPPTAGNSPTGLSQPSCPTILIKGNISARGNKIYHMPGDRAYASVKIDPTAGERYFCSEQDAQAAGWRPSK